MQWVFNPHDLGPDACPYPPGQYPPGANTWIRRELCVSNRYDESRGPGNAHAPGEDTLFVMALMTQGHPPAYVGYAEIGHRVHPSLLSPLEVTKRAFRYGRGIPYTRALPRESLLFRHRYLWLAMKLISVARHGLTALLLSVPIPNERRFLLSVQATMTFGINVGHLNKAWNYRRVTDTLNCPI
jgi:hypothetical protein